MKKFILLFSVFLFCIQYAYAIEFKPLEAPQENAENRISEPKALLNDENYKFKGHVEYDENGVLFLNDDEVDKLDIKIKKPTKVQKKSVLSESNIFSEIEKQHSYRTRNIDEYLISPTSGSLEYKVGNFSYGTTFGTEIDTSQLEYRTKFFAKYDNDFFALMTAIGKDAYTSSGRQMDSIYLSPEIKISKGLTLVDTFKANPEYERCRNDIMLRYSPNIKNSRENFQLEAGLSQTSYYTSGEQSYQFIISTKFKL